MKWIAVAGVMTTLAGGLYLAGFLAGAMLILFWLALGAVIICLLAYLIKGR